MLIFTLFLTLLNLKIIKSSIYTPTTYPDSLINYSTCGIDHPSLICDVDNLLNIGYGGKTKGLFYFRIIFFRKKNYQGKLFFRIMY